MHRYAVLGNPGHSRVYFQASQKMSVAELAIAGAKLSAACRDIKAESIGGVRYITFETAEELAAGDIQMLSRLSFAYALFEIIRVDGREMFLPVAKSDNYYMDLSFSSILKYTGKTNEIFTRMMINVGVMSLEGGGESIILLDPVAGKGTTLYEALICGYHAYGIEIGEKVVGESYHYVKKYLETEKYKHTAQKERVSGPNKSFTATRYSFDIARTKEEARDKKTKRLELVAGNSQYADKYFKKNFFDLVVGDLPYGVQHGNVTAEKQSSLTRNPKELLTTCLPGWRAVLKPKGVVVLAWNTFVLPREEMVYLLREKGFHILEGDGYLDFEHSVDRSIKRDIIVVKKM